MTPQEFIEQHGLEPPDGTARILVTHEWKYHGTTTPTDVKWKDGKY
jgi:hypothetical protein